MSLRNRTPQKKAHVYPDTGLLSETELIALYMKESRPTHPGSFAVSHMSDVLAGALDSAGPEDLRHGLDLIEHAGHQGLQIEYRGMQKQEVLYKTDVLSSPETYDVSSIDTCVHFRDTEYDTDDDTDSLMECGDTFAHKTDMVSPKSGPSSDFSLSKLLDSIQARHINVSSNFQGAQVRLERLREQNGLDSVFLGKLHSSNELMREKIHEMKTEVASMLRDVESMKREEVAGQPEKHMSVNGEKPDIWSDRDTQENMEDGEIRREDCSSPNVTAEKEGESISEADGLNGDAKEQAGEKSAESHIDKHDGSNSYCLKGCEPEVEFEVDLDDSGDLGDLGDLSPAAIEQVPADEPQGAEIHCFLLDNTNDASNEPSEKDILEEDLQLVLVQPVNPRPADSATIQPQQQHPGAGLQHRNPPSQYLSLAIVLLAILAGIYMGYGRA